MPTDQTPKQLISQRIKDASNILVTVSRNPSVDELSAALALTLLLDKMDKVATAVFSGKIPPAIEFLEPGKTFDSDVDGLRDFIIALDKSKADRLRYKVEDDVVRVFITPYKTTITEDDLSFSQGDFNVDLVVAFGVDQREDLDTAITAHGRILHDASVVTINQLPGSGSLGEVEWSDTESSSLCEMLMSLSESLQTGLLDEPIATAILTGLVSATDRFRNDKTSPRVMTMSAQLMAAGANQQLIAEKLETSEEVIEEAPEKAKSDDGEMKVEHDESAKESESETPEEDKQDKAEEKTDVTDLLEKKTAEVTADSQASAIEQAKKELEKVAPTRPAEPEVSEASDAKPEVRISPAKSSSWRDTSLAPPSTGGTLSATTDDAEEERRRVENDDKNRVILSHEAEAAPSVSVPTPPVLNASVLPKSEPTVQDIFAAPPAPVVPAVPQIEPSAPTTPNTTPIVVPSPAPEPPAPTPAPSLGLNFEETPVATPAPANVPTLADLEAQVQQQLGAAGEASTPNQQVDTARAAVDAAFNAQPFDPSGHPLEAAGAQPLGDITQTPAAPIQPDASAAIPMPPLPPMPDLSTLPPMPQFGPAPPVAEQPVSSPTVTPAMPVFGLPEQPAAPAPGMPDISQPAAPSPADPSQFRLPGQ